MTGGPDMLRLVSVPGDVLGEARPEVAHVVAEIAEQAGVPLE